jgi:TolB-like protein/class 3 adenylate cyclase/Tfp pilus assembly protein PilF
MESEIETLEIALQRVMSNAKEPDARLEIAHVLFIDIVGYSKLLIDQQSELIRLLNEVVRGTEQFRAAEKGDTLVRLPTGDGMALAFFSSPDAPVRCAMDVAQKLKEHPRLAVRMGIHSGPVDSVRDVNDRSNVAGAGINMAQRVMECGDAGHILLSKRVADDLAQYERWQPHLYDLGECEVKHGVKIEVVSLYTGKVGNQELPEKLKQRRQEHAALESRAVVVRRRKIVFASVAILFLGLAIGGLWFRFRSLPSNTAAPQPLAVAPVAEKSIAVLPFESFGDEKENAYFADGVQDDILTDLGKVADLIVISRRTVAQFRGSTKDIREIGKALGVAHILEGSVRRLAGRIVVAAQLIDARTAAEVWAEKYDRELADVFTIQSEIAQKIVGQLKASLSLAEKAAIEKSPTRDLEAYDLYLRAYALLYGFGINPKTADDNRPKAEKLLREAIERDPNFALAYAVLSDVQATPNWAEEPTPEQLAKAKESAETAVRLAPESPDAHLALGWLYYGPLHDRTRGVEELEIAARAMPNHIDVVTSLGDVAKDRGQWKEAFERFQKATQIEPLEPEWAAKLSELYLDFRKYREADALADRTIASLPVESTGNFWGLKRIIALARGDTKAAMAAINSNPGRDTSPQSIPLKTAIVLMMERRYPEAIAIIESIPERARNAKNAPRSGLNPFSQGRDLGILGTIYRAQGEKDKARASFDSSRNAFNEWLTRRPEEMEALGWVAVCEAGAGRKDEAQRAAEHAMEIWPMSREPLRAAELRQHVATVYAWTGDRSAAIQLLEQLVKLPGGPDAGDLKLNPRWDDLRADPRFEKLIAEAAKPIEIK